jgi:hypothetical protein
MKSYIVKFIHMNDDGEKSEGMFLCLHAIDKRGAAEKFWQITGGESRGNILVSVMGKDKIEAFWSAKDWKFFTIPQD